MVEKQERIVKNPQKTRQKMVSSSKRFFAEISMRETIQRTVSNDHDEKTDASIEPESRRIVIEIQLKEGIMNEDMKQKILAGIVRMLSRSQGEELSDWDPIKISDKITLRKDFPQFFKGVREAHFLKQREMAEKLGCSMDYVSRIERGRRPGAGFLKKFVKEFGISLEDIYHKI